MEIDQIAQVYKNQLLELFKKIKLEQKVCDIVGFIDTGSITRHVRNCKKIMCFELVDKCSYWSSGDDFFE